MLYIYNLKSVTIKEHLKVKQNVAKGECIPCNTSRCLSCQQLIETTIFENIQTK